MESSSTRMERELSLVSLGESGRGDMRWETDQFCRHWDVLEEQAQDDTMVRVVGSVSL